jgi:hypothetical protein
MYGCAMAKVTSRITPNTDLENYETFYVVRHSKDERHIDEIIRDEMQALGIKAQSGSPESKPPDIDVIVTYEDRWAWDMTNYLLTLTIDFRASDSNVLLATGQSYRPSMERKPPDFMTREILESIFKKE